MKSRMDKITDWICRSDLRTNVAILMMWTTAIFVMAILSFAVQEAFRYIVQ